MIVKFKSNVCFAGFQVHSISCITYSIELKKMLNFFFNTHCMFNSPPIFAHFIWEMHEFMAKFQKEFIFLPPNLYVPTQYYLFFFFLRNQSISMYIRVMDSIYISQNAILTGFLMGISTLFDNFLDYL